VISLRGILGLTTVSLSLGCNLLLTDWQTGEASAGGGAGGDGSHVRRNVIFEADFEGDDPFADFENQQHCCSHSVAQSSEQARTGARSFRAEVRPNDAPVSEGYRAEIVPRGDFDVGERWYGLSVYFETPQAGGKWIGGYGGSFWQWNTEVGGEAALSLIGSDGEWSVASRTVGGGATEGNGPDTRITAGTWHDLVFHVDWRGGVLQFWIDGERHVNRTDASFEEGIGPYMKLGLSRWVGQDDPLPNTWVLFYDDLRIGNENATYLDVAP
jgi:hypothetical protein